MVRFAGAFFTVFFAIVFLAAAFLAAVFFAGAFLMDVFFAAGFFAGALRGAFLATGFFSLRVRPLFLSSSCSLFSTCFAAVTTRSSNALVYAFTFFAYLLSMALSICLRARS
ncbi:MAG: hypothetical protein D6160_04235 [Ketobacter sp.]|nr:MAG: hypothetical protein D6160_04235 [Ketobacter sp.]